MNIIDELTWRGAINQMTEEENLRKLTDEKKISLYCGVDPTGDSLHIGHLIPFMMLKRFCPSGPSSVYRHRRRYRCHRRSQRPQDRTQTADNGKNP